MKQSEIILHVLEPDEGKVLFDGETYASKVYLGKGDSGENWTEVNDPNAPAPESDD